MKKKTNMKIGAKKIKENNANVINCPVTRAMGVIGGKWKPIILFLIDNKINRFGEMQKVLKHISKQMLTSQLRELEKDGVIHRKVFPVVPPKVEYSISEKGRLVLPVIKELENLGKKLG